MGFLVEAAGPSRALESVRLRAECPPWLPDKTKGLEKATVMRCGDWPGADGRGPTSAEGTAGAPPLITGRGGSRYPGGPKVAYRWKGLKLRREPSPPKERSRHRPFINQQARASVDRLAGGSWLMKP